MIKRLLFILILISGLCYTLLAQTVELPVVPNPYLPKLEGSLKTKLEFDLENGKMRFEVRNARLGARGNVNKYIGYRAEIDLSDEGKIRMLDAYVKVTPVKNLDFYLGQRKVPFGTDYLRSPVDEYFANRSFVAKYTNDGLRDIGFVANYSFTFHIPFDIWLSAMNGTGNNNPQWIDKPNYSARMSLEPLKHIRLTGNYYEGSTLLERNLTMYSGEIRYQTANFLIESEYIRRTLTDTSEVYQRQYGFYVHSCYNFYTNAQMIRMISPVLRWDFMGRNIITNEMQADRITAGINFGFEPQQFKAEIRLNYEKYLKRFYDTHFDKFTIEFIAKF